MHQVDELKTASGDGLQNGDGETRRVTFLPEQQARVQELIDEAYRKAYAKALKGKGGTEEVERLKSEVERLKEERRSAVLLRAVSRHNVIDPEEVADLLRYRVREDGDGNLIVVGDSGAVKINGSGAPVSVDEYVSHWLKDRPHHLRPSGAAGGGSQGAKFGHGVSMHDLSDPSSWKTMPREELDRLLKEGLSVQGAAGQSYSFRDVKNPFIEAKRRRFQESRKHD